MRCRQAYAVMGEKDSALKVAERAIMLLPRAKDRVFRTYLRREPGVHSDDRSATIAVRCQLSRSCYKRHIWESWLSHRNAHYAGPS